MSVPASLMALLDSADPAQRAQGAELAVSLGVVDGFFATCVLEPDGLLWRPSGLLAAHLSMLPQASLAARERVRRLVVIEPMASDALAALARLPALTELTFSSAPLADVSALQAFTSLRRLTFSDMSLDLDGLQALTSLEALSLEQCTLERLDVLASLPLRALSLEGSTVAPAPLPSTLTSLNLLAYDGDLPGLDRLSLHTLRGSEATILGLSRAASLTEIDVDRCWYPARLAGLPVRRLTFGGAYTVEHASLLRGPFSLAPFVALPGLQVLRIIPPVATHQLEGVAAFLAHPSLSVLAVDHDWSKHVFAEHWVGSPRQLQSLFGRVQAPHPMSEPAIALRTARHWWSEGFRWRVFSDERDNRINFIRKIRTLFGCGLQQAHVISKRLQGDGLCCLRPADAITFQAFLRSTAPAIIQPWSPDDLR